MSVVADVPVAAAFEGTPVLAAADTTAFGSVLPAGFGGFQNFGGFPAGGLVGAQSFGGFPAGFSGVPAGFSGIPAVGGFSGFPAGGIVGNSYAPTVTAASLGGFGGLGGFSGFPATSGFVGAPVGFGGNSAALALDAADGVIDGTSFGRPIVQTGAAFPSAGFSGIPAVGGFSGLPVAGGFSGFPAASYAPTVTAGSFGGLGGFNGLGGFSGFPATSGLVGAPVGFGGGNSALALDAADGVIDGTNFGRPIVQSGFGGFSDAGFGGYPGAGYGGFPGAGFGGQTVSGAIAAPVAPARKVWQNGARRSLVTGHPTRF